MQRISNDAKASAMKQSDKSVAFEQPQPTGSDYNVGPVLLNDG